MVTGDVCLEDVPKIKVVGDAIAYGGVCLDQALDGTEPNLIEVNRLVAMITTLCQGLMGICPW